MFTHHQRVRFRTHPATTVSSPTDVEPSSLFLVWCTVTSFRGGILGVFCETLMNVQTHFLVSNERRCQGLRGQSHGVVVASF